MNKYRVYIDEVGNNDLKSSENPNHRYLSLTGLIFELNYVKEVVTPSLEKLKQKYFPYHPDEPIILHRKELVNKKYPFNALKNPEIEEQFNSDFLNLLNELDYVVVSVLIDKLEHNIKYQTWKYDPYHYCLEIIVERYYFFLESVNSCGDIMIESRGGNEDIRLKESYKKIYANETQFIEAHRLQKRLTSKELKVKQKMLNIACLQLADLIAHPSRRFMFKKYGINEGKEYTFGDKIIEVIENKYYKGKTGIEGYGIKRLP
ncbi:MAG: DUF3800 domain-containing protein [Ignavibacteria bacterium]|jgi:hypothetical protein|nr:DUF3800 domain-containing protein [Ignavibacteria bacterium]MDH7528377.1 DUF3800 domain-containing protein [Ignavibacteria bacterium]